MTKPLPCKAPISIETKYGPQHVRCKQCLSCRIHKQSALTLRCLLEAAGSNTNLFVTLTYREAPEKGDLKDIQAFLKRWHARETYLCPSKQRTRYLSVGEYGHKHGRFHYHVLLFNTLPSMAEMSTELWPHGFVKVGTVTPQSIRYTARYTLKFDTKGEEAVAGWSKKPPLGGPTMRLLARRLKMDGRFEWLNTSPPKLVELNGKSWPLDEAMQREFWREWQNDEKAQLPTGGANAHLEYLHTQQFGDPIKAQRDYAEVRNTFWETARFVRNEF